VFEQLLEKEIQKNKKGSGGLAGQRLASDPLDKASPATPRLPFPRARAAVATPSGQPCRMAAMRGGSTTTTARRGCKGCQRARLFPLAQTHSPSPPLQRSRLRLKLASATVAIIATELRSWCSPSSVAPTSDSS